MIYWLWEVLDWISLPILAALIIIFVLRRLYRELRFFFVFIVASELATLARLAVLSAAPKSYFYTYWVSELVVTIFTFLAVFELFLVRLFPRFYRIRLYRNLFAAFASVLIFLAWLTALESPNKAAALLIEARVLEFVLAGVLAFLVSLMLIMGRNWNLRDLGIAVGFAINIAAYLATSALWARTRYRSTSLDQLPLIGFDIACAIWLWAVLYKLQESTSELPVTPTMLHEARKWESALKDWLTPGKK